MSGKNKIIGTIWKKINNFFYKLDRNNLATARVVIFITYTTWNKRTLYNTKLGQPVLPK